jgi:hypothetical protein
MRQECRVNLYHLIGQYQAQVIHIRPCWARSDKAVHPIDEIVTIIPSQIVCGIKRSI